LGGEFNLFFMDQIHTMKVRGSSLPGLSGPIIRVSPRLWTSAAQHQEGHDDALPVEPFEQAFRPGGHPEP
jgi:hypothetical protein